jgi:dihydroorotate dehydrogenase (fumarate)
MSICQNYTRSAHTRSGAAGDAGQERAERLIDDGHAYDLSGDDARSPLVASASPLSESIDNIKRLEDAGAGAVVLHSLFEEQIRHDRKLPHHHMLYGTESTAEALTYFPEPERYSVGPDGYLEHIRKAREAVNIPIIASLNGMSIGGWTQFARHIEQAGADALN